MTDINRFLATEAMGWTISPYLVDEADLWEAPNGSLEFKGSLKKMEWWSPTTNLAQAFMVVEAMREKGWMFKLTSDVYTKKKWWAIFFGKGLINGEADTPAAAICHAAAKALGWEDN